MNNTNDKLPDPPGSALANGQVRSSNNARQVIRPALNRVCPSRANRRGSLKVLGGNKGEWELSMVGGRDALEEII